MESLAQLSTSFKLVEDTKSRIEDLTARRNSLTKEVAQKLDALKQIEKSLEEHEEILNCSERIVEIMTGGKRKASSSPSSDAECSPKRARLDDKDLRMKHLRPYAAKISNIFMNVHMNVAGISKKREPFRYDQVDHDMFVPSKGDWLAYNIKGVKIVKRAYNRPPKYMAMIGDYEITSDLFKTLKTAPSTYFSDPRDACEVHRKVMEFYESTITDM